METHFEGGHSIVASFVDGSGDLYVASRESGDILKVGADAGEDKSAFEARCRPCTRPALSRHIYSRADRRLAGFCLRRAVLFPAAERG